MECNIEIAKQQLAWTWGGLLNSSVHFRFGSACKKQRPYSLDPHVNPRQFFEQIQEGLDEEMSGAKFLDIEVAKQRDGGAAGENVERSLHEYEKLLGMTMGIRNHLHLFNIGNSKFAPDEAINGTKRSMQQLLDTLVFHWRRALANNLHKHQPQEIFRLLRTIRDQVEGPSCGCSFNVPVQESLIVPERSKKAKRCPARPGSA